MDLDVRLSDAPSFGFLLFSETHNDVPLNDGIFSIMIGSQTAGGVPDLPLDVSEMYVSVSVNGQPELTPRTRIGMVPYAAKANKAEVLVRPDTFDPAAADSNGNIDVANYLNFALLPDPLSTAGHNNTIPTRMWIAHSEAFPTYGIQYRDYSSDGYGSDAIEFVGGSTGTPRFSFETYTGDFVMTNPNGDKNIEARSRFSSSNTGAWMTLRDNQSERTSFAARNADSDQRGLIDVRNDDALPTIRLIADNGSADGQIELYDSGNTLQAFLDGDGELADFARLQRAPGS